MPNPLIDRVSIHEWVDHIAENSGSHKTAITRLVRSQRKLAKYVDTQAQTISAGQRHTAIYLLGVVLRIFDLAGGKLKRIAVPQVVDAEGRVKPHVAAIMPPDEGLAERVRSIEGRAQPHLLDEMLMDLWNTPDTEPVELLKLFLLLWIVVEVVDEHWVPPNDFSGPDVYAYVPIAPTPPDTSAT
ncbi:MAG: hypothetical protein AAGA48_31360 [Myxococcota bacterium]